MSKKIIDLLEENQRILNSWFECDLEGTSVERETYRKLENNNDQALALCKNQPECKTCGDTKEVRRSEVDECPGDMITTEDLYKPCPKCNQPELGEFTAKLINTWNEYISTSFSDTSKKRELASKVNYLIGKVCDIIDRQAEQNKDLQARINKLYANYEVELTEKQATEIKRLTKVEEENLAIIDGYIELVEKRAPETERLKELLRYPYELPMNEACDYDENVKWNEEVKQALNQKDK